MKRRPEAIGRLLYAFNLTHEFTKQVENFTRHQSENATRWISEKEMDDLWSLANETQVCMNVVFVFVNSFRIG